MFPNYKVEESFAEFDTEANYSDIEEPENKVFECARKCNEILSV